MYTLREFSVGAAVLALMFAGCAPLELAPEAEKEMEFIHEVDLKKDQIFDKAMKWMAQTFVDSKEVIDLKDRESGTIVGKGMTSFVSNGIVSIPCRYTMTIEMKDGKYRTHFGTLTGMWGEYANDPQLLLAKNHIDQVREKLVVLDGELAAYLKKPNKDW